MAGTDLGSIISQLSQSAGALGTDALQGIAQNRDLRQQVVDATTKAAGIEVDLAQYDLQQQLEMESRKKATAQAFGSDILDPDNRIAYLAREQAAAQDEWLAKSKRSTQLLDMGFFDSPLEYMVSRPFTNRVIESATIAKERMNGLDKAITDINNGTQQTVLTQKALNTELTLEEAAHRAELAKLKADSVIAAAQIQANEAGFKDFKTIYELDRHEREFSARMAEMKANREDRAARKAAEKEGEEEQLALYNQGAAVLNLPPITNMNSFKLAVKANKNHVAAVIQQGESVWVDPKDPTNKAEQIASTPGESVVRLQAMKGNFYTKSERVGALLKEQFAQSAQETKAANPKATNEEVAVAINTKLYGKTDKEGKQVPGTISIMSQDVEQNVGSKANIFRAPDVNTMATANPSLTQSPAWKEIIVPSVNASGPSPTYSSMKSQAQLAVAEKKLTVEEASKFISTYFENAVTLNASTEKYSLYGIKQPMEYKVNNGTKFSATPTINAASEEQVKRDLLVGTATNLLRRLQGTTTNMGR